MANETIEILKLLISNKQESYSIRKIALLRKINYKSAYQALKKLEKEGVVELKKTGNTIICSFNEKFNDLVFKAEYSRREDLFKDKNFSIMYEDISKIESPIIVILFGSQAKGTATKHSDIDLLLIADKEVSNKVQTEINIYNHKIHLTHVSYESFMRMVKSKEFSVVSEAIKNNIILIGIEEYYRLLKNVKQ
ncbi:MAG TPA: nucleotidyltransferase domain-containing protein [Candidatus Nanoarchaeia archaeon]|nr:nucleotidyltransferase domain-containing protein [Candidatus Nanoarchaeia archaeon]